MTLNHGGDLVSAQNQSTRELLDMSVNLNPLGPPAPVLDAARGAVACAERYPDPLCRSLRQAIAQCDGVRPEQVFCGAGASDVIFRLALLLRPKAALLLAPAFSEYESSLAQVGCECRFHMLRRENRFDVTEAILSDIRPGIELVLLCSPNNPTGRLVGRGLLEKILACCEKTGAMLAVDECFLPLASGGEGLADLLEAHPRLFLLRAFTKTYAIAGLRLGYGLGTPELIGRLFSCGPCWNVSGPAQAAGLACCRLPDWPVQGKTAIEALRPALQAELLRLGCEVIPGSANYLLFRLPGVTDLKQRLISRGILLRGCADYRGLGHDWYRTAVKTEADNGRFLRALRAELEE